MYAGKSVTSSGISKIGLLGNGTNLLCEPCLSGFKAGKLCNGAVTELDIGVDKGHQRLDLCELCLAFVVGIGVGIYLCLTLGNLLLACLEGLLALLILSIAFGESLLALLIGLKSLFILALACVVSLVACIKLILACIVVLQTFCVSTDAVVIRIFVLLQKCDSILKLADNICCLGILFLVLLDGQTVLDTETGGDQTKQADKDEENAHHGGKRCFLHTFPLINSSVVCPWEGKWHFNYLYAVCLHFVNKLSNCQYKICILPKVLQKSFIAIFVHFC